MQTETKTVELEKEIAKIINRYSLENGSNTPDFILAQYLLGCIDNFNQTVIRRESWFGRGKDFVPNENGKVSPSEEVLANMDKEAKDC